MPRYNAIQELPEWGKPTVKKLCNLGALQGNGHPLDKEGYPTDMDLSHDMLRQFVINDRMGLYNGQKETEDDIK